MRCELLSTCPVSCFALRTLHCRVFFRQIDSDQYAIVQMHPETGLGPWRVRHDGSNSLNVLHAAPLGLATEHDQFLHALAPQFRELGEQFGLRHIGYAGIAAAAVAFGAIWAGRALVTVAAALTGLSVPAAASVTGPSILAVALGLGLLAMLCQALENHAIHHWISKVDAAIATRQRASPTDSLGGQVVPLSDLRRTLEQMGRRFAM